MKTSYGSIVAVIFVDRAPLTAGNFLRYVDQGLYDKAEFYRALRPDNGTHLPTLRLIQGGVDPTCLHPPVPPIAHEPTMATGLSHVDGALSMARWSPGTAASEFFIVVGAAPELDSGGRYGEGFAVFGQVLEGMDVVRKILAGATVQSSGNEYLQDAALQSPVAVRIRRSQ